ncbi:CSLREA domain-containing protein [Acinetobacter sp. VNH17]|uniref:CSLREA domain-containing protein n=1 Tax=Acinetobacter thutiue TaxID=2998078 RepID=A0ABT7WNM8_9GAMM|nr:CSLREA domain-containing protein [Acinetobacter thutiue]MCY6412189.1 CSLREA domain-containing protein [Acinetobacter thutiue]MDN0014293.1 CSLREA domain-containing protein [Acinetobacter thutiue]
MKNYKKAILATMILATMPLLAATSDAPINVTTFEDEDGENLNACSLREALKAAELRKPYGGCESTDILSTTQKVIQLQAGEYILKKELIPNVNVLIWGASPVDWQEKKVLINDIVNQYPAETPLKTIIKADNSRIFNTTFGAKELTLNNLILTGGRTSDKGGAIYAGADVVLQNTQILNSKADQEGGAIFLAGPTASLTLTDSLIQKNTAPKGSVLSMSCFNDVVYSKRKVNLTGSSFIENGATDSDSMFELCGEPEVILTNNTIAQNSVKISTGNLIKFTGDATAENTSNNKSSILSNGSSLTLTSNTIVENQGYTTLLYDKLGSKNLNSNIIAYNGGSDSYACRYLLGDVSEQESVRFTVQYNALSLKKDDTTDRTANQCDLPKEALKDNKTNINISDIDIRTLLSPLQPASKYTSFFPLYYPKNNGTETDLVDIEGTGCSSTDQRGLARNTNQTLYFNPEAANRCDIGSVELMKLTAGDISDLANSSISELIKSYQSQYDFFKDLVEKPNDEIFLTYYKSRLEQYENLLKYTKENLKYRAIFVDLNNYKLPLPREVELTEGDDKGSYKLDFFNPDSYEIKVERLGVGQLNGKVLNIQQPPDPNLMCDWNEKLQQIVIYRKDDVITQAGDKAFCKYTITTKPGIQPEQTSSGLIQAAFVNIAPVAKDTSVTLKYRQHEKATLNLLSFANDDGDTGEGGKGPENNPNKPAFWKNEEGVELPIRLTNVPTRDLTITADRQGACPEPDDKEICYGGNIYVQEVNTFNPFNFSFNYQVYDADGTASNAATVSVISTATTTDDTRPAGSGGGSTGIFSILGLLSLLIYRRFRK